MNAVDLCEECPWPGKCEADEICWLEVEWNDEQEPESPPKLDEDPGPES